MPVPASPSWPPVPPPPRVRFKDWLEKTATLSLFQVRGGFYEGIARHCPDEEAQRRLKRSTPSALAPSPLPSWRTSPRASRGPLTETGSDAIRRSGADRGMGRLVDMPAQTLPQLAGIPFDASALEDVPLDKFPGFTAKRPSGRSTA